MNKILLFICLLATTLLKSETPVSMLVSDVTNFTAVSQIKGANVSWTNPTTLFSNVLIVAKEGTGFTTVPTLTEYIYDPSFIGGGSVFEGGKVVYQGTGTSVKITDLAPEKTYFIRIYVRDGTTWSVGVETTVTPTAPVIPNVTGLTAVAQTKAATVTWTNPTPATAFTNVLVVAKEGSGFMTKPTLLDYLYDPSFIGGGAAFEGGKVVYQGTAKTLSIKDLTPNKTYFIRVYVQNAGIWTTGVETSVTVLPIPNVTGLTAVVQGTSAVVNWTNPIPAANFSDVLVVAKEATGFTTTPTIAFYTFDPNFVGGGAVFEDGKVVYQGTAKTVTVTNLAPNKTYFVRVYVRDGETWSQGIETSVKTSSVPNVTNLTAVSQAKSASVNWVNPTPATSFNYVLVVAKEGSGFTTTPNLPEYLYDPSFIGGGAAFEGGKVIYQGTAKTVNITDLTPNKTYFVRVYVLNGLYWSAGVEISVTVSSVANVTGLTTTKQGTSSVVTWTNPTPATAFSDVLVVAKEGSGFTTTPVNQSYIFDPNFIGGGEIFEGGKAIYQGTGKTVTITNLTPNKNYFIRVYVRDGAFWSQGVETSVNTAIVIPNVTALAAAVKAKTAAVTWKNPTPATAFTNVLVVVKADSGFTTAPTATEYLFDANIAGGGADFEGGKVAYQGIASTVTITSLLPDKTYFIRVYVQNLGIWSQGVETKVTIPGVPNVTTLAATAQPKAASVSWKNPTPTTAFKTILVVAKEGSGFTTAPTDASYIFDANFTGVGADFEGGKVVYQGTGTKVSVTNLTPNKTYFIRVYVRDSMNWSKGVQTSVAVLAAPNVTSLTATVQTTNATVSWKNPTPATAFTNVLVVAKADSGFTTIPTDTSYIFNASMIGAGADFEGGKAVYQGTGKKVVITNLTLGKTYFIRVYTRNGKDWSPGIETSVILPAAGTSNLVRLEEEQDKQQISGKVQDEATIVEKMVTIKTDNAKSYVFNVFPNPAKDRVSIDLSECKGKTVDISIVNFLGREVYKEKINAAPNAPHSLDISHLIGGQYMVRIVTDGKNETIKKFVIAH